MTMPRNRWTTLLDDIRRARRYRSLPAQAWDLVTHKLRLNTHPVDYYRYEFYDGTRTWAERGRYVGKNGSQYYPYQENPVEYVALFRNKILFGALLQGLDLPHPARLGTIGPGREIADEHAFDTFLATSTGAMVLKPSEGSGGKNVLFVARDGAHLQLNGASATGQEIWRRLRAYAFDKGYLAERVIENCAGIRRYHPPSLNTYRIVTVRTRDQRWHVATTVLRVGRSGRRLDNVSSGGLCVFIDRTGRTVGGYDWNARERLDVHPDTRIPLAGDAPAGRAEAESLALRASAAIAALGSIGWDIAMTPDGPVILEGNAFYDSGYWQVRPGFPLISEEISRGLPRFRPFTHWDRRRVWPGFKPHGIRS